MMKRILPLLRRSMQRRTCFVPLLALISLLPGMAAAEECVLFLGDSFSMGAFGRSLDENLRKDGLKVYTYAAGGASPYYWLSSYEPIPSSIGFWKKTPTTDQRLGYIRAVPKIEPLMDACKPDYVVIQTGVNLYATLRSKRRPKEENIAEVSSLIDDMCKAIDTRGARSYWVLPPRSHEDRYPSSLQQELSEIMTLVVKKYKGGVFESRKFTRFTDPYPATDGIHYGPEESTVWAQKTAGDFRSFSKIKPTLLTKNDVPRAKPVTVPMIADAPIGGKGSEPVAYESTRPEPPSSPQPVVAEKPAVKMADAKSADTPPEKAKGGDAAAETKVAAADMPPKPMTVDKSSAPEDTPVKEVGSQGKFEPDPATEYDLVLKLIAKSEVKDLSSVTYGNALGVFEYEVTEDVHGNYPFKKIRIAHGIVLNRKPTRANNRKVGDSIGLVVVPLARYPGLQRWQTVDDLRPNFEMPLFVPKL